jgi:hypothetical protein
MKIEGNKKPNCCWCNKPSDQKMIQNFNDGSCHVDFGCQKHYEEYKNTYDQK